MASPIASPRYWPTWIGVGAMWLIARLPLRLQFSLGRLIGVLGYRFASARRHIARTNVELCLPELDAEARDDLVQRVFVSTGIGAIETAIAWFGDLSRYRSRTSIEGLELLTAAQRRGRGVLLVGAHFTTLDLAGALLSTATELDVIYRYNKNPVIEYIMRRGRQRRFAGVIERSDPREILTRLQAGHTIWYAADQDYGRKVSVFAPFFSVPAATITATARFARFNSSDVMFISHFRDADTRTWSLHLQQIGGGYPTGDDLEDARRINAVIEHEIRRHPDQYLWLHRRFKTRPIGEPRPY
jgi:Kdo2-lipid IVA lauroyltransferase/acyltransferase